jgi:phospholipid transport system substrate-binding protein
MFRQSVIRHEQIILVLTLVLAGNPVSADPLDAQQTVSQTLESLRTAVTRDTEAIKSDPEIAGRLVSEIVLPMIDTPRIGKWLLGKHWGQATPSQRQQFNGAYQQMMLRLYASQLTDYSHVRVDYLPVRGSVDETADATVRTAVKATDRDAVPIDYRLHLDNKQWKVYDIRVDGISLVATLRAEVDHDINKLGIEGLIKHLNERSSGVYAQQN